MKALITGAAVAATMWMCVSVAPLHAHHSASMFELLTPIWFEGTVVRFLNSDPQTQQVWCGQRNRAYIQSTPDLKAFVDEMTRLVSPPCA